MAEKEQEEKLRWLRDDASKLADLGISISGLAGRFPKSDSMNEFRRNLELGVDMLNEQDSSRFECGLWNLPPRAGRLKDISKFDNEFFGLSSDDANNTDHQARILYEVIYESILDAGLNPSELRGTNTGLYLGYHCLEFERIIDEDPASKGRLSSGQVATKMAQYFDLRGVCCNYDTACASAMAAFHSAVEAIKLGLIDRAIVCGTNVPINPVGSFVFLQMQMLSPTGSTRFLDSKADGYVKSEAVVSILIQRQELAIRSYAGILNSMTSVDGYKKEGITFPSGQAQERLVRQSKLVAKVHSNHVQYVEAHGTGTPAGDPEEANALVNVYHPSLPSGHFKPCSELRTIGPLQVGSLKTNMGHSEGVSGLCSIAKVSMMLENELIYKSLHHSSPNEQIDSLKDGRLQVVVENTKLDAQVVPISCCGFGGVNVHVILKANGKPVVEPLDDATGSAAAMKQRIVAMFGRSKHALDGFFDGLMDRESMDTRNCLSDDFLFMLDRINSKPIDRLMSYRGYVIVQDNKEIARQINRCELAKANPGECQMDMARQVHLQDARKRPCHVILPGLGCEYSQMASGLRNFELFWNTIERLNAHLMAKKQQQGLKFDLIDILTSKTSEFTCFTQKFVAIIAYEVALINSIRDGIDLGDCITSFVGHSLGEIACAYGRKLINEHQAIMMAYEFGKTVDENLDCLEGKMVALMVSEQQALGVIESLRKLSNPDPLRSLQVCCVNGPESVTISGSHQDMDKLLAHLSAKLSLDYNIVDATIALHNRIIVDEDMELKFRQAFEVILTNGQIIRCWTPNWVPTMRPLDLTQNELVKLPLAEYLARSMASQVVLHESMAQFESNSIVLELGPSSLFGSQVKLMNNGHDYIGMAHKLTPAGDQHSKLLRSIGQLYLAGAQVNFVKLNYAGSWDQQQRQVRRQTPSLSSMVKWNHEQSFFVPRYPLYFSKSSSKMDYPIEVMEDRDKYLLDHAIEGRPLFPATGYLFFVWRIFSFVQNRIFDACYAQVEKALVPIEFHQVRLHRAIMLTNSNVPIHLHLEEGSGRFEVKEGSSVVVDGYARSPQFKPNELRYEQVRQRLMREHHELTMTSDDIYKQFRVCGYDYGPKFRNIKASSDDGRYSQINYNGRFTCFADNVLQTVFLAVSKYTASGSLFLPTRLDYVRIVPQMIFKKLRDLNITFDFGDDALNVQKKKDAMIRAMGQDKSSHESTTGAVVATGEGEQLEQAPDTTLEGQQTECLFDTFCDPSTGIVITDGIEMRGIRATPAPRRAELSQVLLESQQFVRDSELPVADELLTNFRAEVASYVEVCNSMAIQVLDKTLGSKGLALAKELLQVDEPEAQFFVDLERDRNYVQKHLVSRFHSKDSALVDLSNIKHNQITQPTVQDQPTRVTNNISDDKDYDIFKNGNKMLLSTLDRLQQVQEACQVKQIVECNRIALMHDLIQRSFLSERFMRPVGETLIENCCQKKLKLRLLEINTGEALLCKELNQMLKSIEPKLNLDYSLGHSNIHELEHSRNSSSTTNKNNNNNNKWLCNLNEIGVKKYTISHQDLQSSMVEAKLKDFDVIVYKDISCYSLPQRVVEKNGLPPVISSLKSCVKPGGFVLVLMRQSLTLAERILLSMSQPELIGLSKRDLRDIKSTGSLGQQNSEAHLRIGAINSILSQRCKMMQLEAENNDLISVSRKSDPSGCLMLLFRTNPAKIIADDKDEQLQMTHHQQEPSMSSIDNRLVLRVKHDNIEQIEAWLRTLKENFKPQDEDDNETGSADENKQNCKKKVTQECQTQETISRNKTVWLCGITTKQDKLNGIIGMVKSLVKELGSSYLRCYYDCYSFKNRDEPVDVIEIEQCEKFQLALRRDLLWNCVNFQGHFGSFRHFTVNQIVSNDDCLTDVQEEEFYQAIPKIHNDTPDLANRQPDGCFVNAISRGDLSSLTWIECPHKYLTATERKCMVDVHYSALNFRDVMLASGRLPLDVLPASVVNNDNLIGFEYSGIDTGSGRRVMGICSGRGLATRVLATGQSSVQIEIPECMDMREAATIPIVYATAIMALVQRGKMKRGESVLIHLGSGGLGQAAIELCNHHGVEIYTTVGTQEKREFLLQRYPNCLEESRIFSSRDCDFERKIMAATKGRGVDLVLNSIADDKLQASIRCLADGGRFLEVGKYDMAINSQLEMALLDTNKTFHGILLDKLFDLDEMTPSFKASLEQVFEIMREGLREGYIKPISYTVFKHNQVEKAFRHMATGSHIGKVLIEMRNSDGLEPRVKCMARFELDPNKSYVITGGLGGFGIELCKWLATQGARKLIITSRQGIRDTYQRLALERLESVLGCQCVVIKSSLADTLTEDGCEKLCKLACDMAPSKQIGGIFHLAMVLRDSLLHNMTAEDFKQVCEPKVTTGHYLDLISERMSLNLDYFVCFSSITCGKGNAGQANYAYANSCLERICEQRRARGQHGLAIQWGAIGDVGVAYENLGGNELNIGGTLAQRMPSCQATLSKLLCSPFAVCSSVVPADRKSDNLGQKGDLVAAVFHVLGIKDPSKVSDDSTLGDLGLDSLMAVEIRQYIEREYDKTLSIQEIRSLTIHSIRELSEQQQAQESAQTKSSSEQKKLAKTTEVAKQIQGYGQQAKQAVLDGSQSQSQRQRVNERVQLHINRQHVAGFLPQLQLPSNMFEPLNFNDKPAELLIASCATKSLSKTRPLFFIPPVHGSFEQLKQVAQLIERPCIGLNWVYAISSASSIKEAAEKYISALQAITNSQSSNRANNNSDLGEPKVEVFELDLVGYSFGATLAFEIMCQLRHDRNYNSANIKPGRLVMLDGSPQQVEFSAQIMSDLADGQRLNDHELANQLLMVFIGAHVGMKNAQQIDFVELRETLDAHDVSCKPEIAAEVLQRWIGRSSSELHKSVSLETLAMAMRSFIGKSKMILDYKCKQVLDIASCSLIRAEGFFFSAIDQNFKFDQDLGVSKCVSGELDLSIFPGDHTSFLCNNKEQIATKLQQQKPIITNKSIMINNKS